jgi:hypothetical protein
MWHKSAAITRNAGLSHAMKV